MLLKLCVAVSTVPSLFPSLFEVILPVVLRWHIRDQQLLLAVWARVGVEVRVIELVLVGIVIGVGVRVFFGHGCGWWGRPLHCRLLLFLFWGWRWWRQHNLAFDWARWVVNQAVGIPVGVAVVLHAFVEDGHRRWEGL